VVSRRAPRLTALGGANVISIPPASGWHRTKKGAIGAAQLDAWKTIQRATRFAKTGSTPPSSIVSVFEGKPENATLVSSSWGNFFRR